MLGAGGALGGAALAAPAAAALAAPAAVPREVALLAAYVAGTAYHEAGQAAAMLHPGDRLMLRREPRNDYDARAIEVRTRAGAKLGYLPRIDNHALASLMDAGFELTARIRAIAPDPRQPDIRLEVTLTV